MRGLGAVFGFVLLIGCADAHAETQARSAFVAPFVPERPRATASEPFEPLPIACAPDPAEVALGAKLFVDPRLSGDGRVSCAHCHSFALGGANGAVHSALTGRPAGAINVPTVFNVAFDFRYGWNGRFDSLEAALDFAISAPAAMASTWTRAWHGIERDSGYAPAFAKLYPRGTREAALRAALVTYARSLVTPNARFDRYLRGELPLSPHESRGYTLFRDYGCSSCHQGINVGANMYQRFGVMRDYFEDRGKLQPADLGLFNATGDAHDKFVFRVPSLRNVGLTAPYFHDGSAPTLEAAIRVMARYQLDRELTTDEVTDLAAFLRTLTGELERQPL